MHTPAVSFEFFPPQNLEASFRLWDTVQILAPLAPRFVSVTYGAGGTTRELTRDAVATLHRNSGLKVAAHLTCVNATRAETLEIAEGFATAGVTDIVALRGDPPKGSGAFQAHTEGFASSIELIEALKATGRFTIRVGAYPEKHPESATQQADIDWLKRKIDAGADEALTQFFFEAETFLRFRDACEKAGIDGARVTPGILPISPSPLGGSAVAEEKLAVQKLGIGICGGHESAFKGHHRCRRVAGLAKCDRAQDGEAGDVGKLRLRVVGGLERPGMVASSEARANDFLVTPRIDGSEQKRLAHGRRSAVELSANEVDFCELVVGCEVYGILRHDFGEEFRCAVVLAGLNQRLGELFPNALELGLEGEGFFVEFDSALESAAQGMEIPGAC